MKRDTSYLLLKPHLVEQMFSRFLLKYGWKNSKILLGKAHCLVYAYKNGKTKYIPWSVVNKLIELNCIETEKVNKNTLNRITGKDLFDKGLIIGREVRYKKSKEDFRIDIKIKDFVIEKDGLLHVNIFKWLEKTQWIKKLTTNGRFIKNARYVDNKDCIHISYLCYNKGVKSYSHYENCLPKQLLVDFDFMYFLGLHFGDGTGIERFGIINKDTRLIEFTSYFLKKINLHQKINGALFLYRNRYKVPIGLKQSFLSNLVDNLQIYTSDKPYGDYVFSVFITNNLISKIIFQIERDLSKFMHGLKKELVNAFLAGIFDSEGNVDKLGRSLRFSQKTVWKKDVILSLLVSQGYTTRYDTCNILIGFKNSIRERDFLRFRNDIFPFLKHTEKVKEAEDLLNGYYIKDYYKVYIQLALKFPGITNREFIQFTNKKKNQRELRNLAEQGYLERKGKIGESFKYYPTAKGLLWLKSSQ